MLRPASVIAVLCAFAMASVVSAEPLHREIDRLIAARAGDVPAARPADDAEFLRRIYLDLAGRIPSVQEARAFLDDESTDKRAQLIDRLLASPDYPRRMQEQFHVMLMERLGDHPEWQKYLRESFAANKPWDQLAREILGGGLQDGQPKGAAFFYAKRLENYGQNPVDYPGLTRDVGRLFLGMDLACAQCHNHLFIKSYKQADFQGLHAFFQNTFLAGGLNIGEKPTTQKLGFQSVFKKEPLETAPRVPGLPELELPAIEKGKEFIKAPDPKTKAPGVLRFSPLAKLAEQLPTAENAAFSKNIVNRLWWVMLGRGLVHPLDLHHADNPASHPELLDLLAKEFVEHKYDIQWLLRELALSQTYQRSSVLPNAAEPPSPALFLVAHEKRVSAEQLLHSMLEATGERANVKEGTALDQLQLKFLRAFANPRREPEDTFNPSLKAALFVLNDDTVLGWLNPKSGNLAQRLADLQDADKLAEELYLSVLARRPTGLEKQEVAAYLMKKGDQREQAIKHLAWALLASTEFSVNH
ncbi:MAG: DUF1549 domain-containing protein [Planctomycetia bacterium]|nr:DUF1549 domain-containing protein [Planctomycetia bacterium]